MKTCWAFAARGCMVRRAHSAYLNDTSLGMRPGSGSVWPTCISLHAGAGAGASAELPDCREAVVGPG